MAAGMLGARGWAAPNPSAVKVPQSIPSCLGLDVASAASVTGTILDGQPESAVVGRMVNETIVKVAKQYGFDPATAPGLRYAHGPREGDAWVADDAYVANTRHTVILGAARIAEESAIDYHYGRIGIDLVVAHEMAHIFQLNTQLVQTVSAQTDQYIRVLELHADMLAGWFLGSDPDWPTDAFQVACARIETWGDGCTTSANHHGFGFERQSFLTTGYSHAKSDAGSDITAVSKDAYDALLKWVTSVRPGWSVCGK